MEQVENINLLNRANWIDKRSREIVFSVLAKLTYGQLEIIEGSQHSLFPENANCAEVTGKIYVHDLSMYRDFVKGGSIGASEAFIAGKWLC
jgi:cyclopropane-fatty-acyl-phospholipid synthase